MYSKKDSPIVVRFKYAMVVMPPETASPNPTKYRKALPICIPYNNIVVKILFQLNHLLVPFPYYNLWFKLEKDDRKRMDMFMTKRKSQEGVLAFYSFIFGSRASRRPSPTKLKQSTVIRIIKPGAVGTHHWLSMIVIL